MITEALQENPQNRDEFTVTVNFSPLESNPSWLTRRNMIIGSVTIGIVVTAAAVTAYYLSVNPVFTENTELSRNQSTLSLYNITKLIDQPSKTFGNCESVFDLSSEEFTECIKTVCAKAFQVHLDNFTSCGETICACIRNARDVFALHCSTYAKNIVHTLKECTNAANTMQKCIEREC